MGKNLGDPSKGSHQKHNVSNYMRLSRKNSPFHFGASGESQKETKLQKMLERQHRFEFSFPEVEEGKPPRNNYS